MIPGYLPYSRTYLIDRMHRVSLGIVKLAIYGTSTLITAAGLYWLATLIW